jgi:hypothetical protein
MWRQRCYVAYDKIWTSGLPHCQWKSHRTISIRCRTRCVLLHYDSSKRCVCPLYKSVYSFKFLKLFSNNLYCLKLQYQRSSQSMYTACRLHGHRCENRRSETSECLLRQDFIQYIIDLLHMSPALWRCGRWWGLIWIINCCRYIWNKLLNISEVSYPMYWVPQETWENTLWSLYIFCPIIVWLKQWYSIWGMRTPGVPEDISGIRKIKYIYRYIYYFMINTENQGQT